MRKIMGLALGLVLVLPLESLAAPEKSKDLAPAATKATKATTAPPASPGRTTNSPAAAAKSGPGTSSKSKRPRSKPGVPRPLQLDAQKIEGRAEGPRVLFVHAGPQIALEDAPEHPSYLRDDFTAALSSPVRVRVRPYEPLRPPTKGENR